MKRVTVKDLATELGLSLGAINKALNNKPGVSDATRTMVLETAEKLGYRVNKVAQSMARGTIKIGILLPTVFPEYFDSLKKGIETQYDILCDYNVECKYYRLKSLHSYQETVDVLEQCVQDGMNGIILYPPQEFGMHEILNRLYEKNIPVVLVGSDIRGSQRICCVRVDAACAGRLAAEFMSMLLPANASVIAFVGNKDMNEHREKADAFLQEARERNLNVIGIYETHDDLDIAYFLTGKIIQECGNISGIYIATANSVSVCRYLEERHLGDIRVIGTDVFQATNALIHDGIMQGVIFQNAERQGTIALRVLYEHITESRACDETVFVSPQLVLKSNIQFYLD